MNKLILMGRLTADPEIRYSNDTAVARFNFAVNRTFHREGDPEADFFSCVVFGKTAETMEKCNVRKGQKLLLDAEIRNNNYTDKDGVKHYSMQVVVSRFEFCESKSVSADNTDAGPALTPAPEVGDGFMNIPDGIDEELPFT